MTKKVYMSREKASEIHSRNLYMSGTDFAFHIINDGIDEYLNDAPLLNSYVESCIRAEKIRLAGLTSKEKRDVAVSSLIEHGLTKDTANEMVMQICALLAPDSDTRLLANLLETAELELAASPSLVNACRLVRMTQYAASKGEV